MSTFQKPTQIEFKNYKTIDSTIIVLNERREDCLFKATSNTIRYDNIPKSKTNNISDKTGNCGCDIADIDEKINILKCQKEKIDEYINYLIPIDAELASILTLRYIFELSVPKIIEKLNLKCHHNYIYKRIERFFK